ncbi:MAG: flagellar basal-body MS-ring/collar protein FliF [Desulfatiglandaceae bacterium]
MTPTKIFSLVFVVAITIAGFILLMVWSGKSDMQPLYTNLNSEDAGAILARLKEKKIPYEVSANQDSILVPGDQLYEIRLEMASLGLPLGSGVGFEIFDNAKLGMTEFVQNVNFQRALQGELSRTINGFDEVKGSRVHIVMGSDSLFSEDEKPATASVILKLQSGEMLSKGQVKSIVHLVSSSVSGLNPENVTVVDNFGKMLAGSSGRSSEGPTSSDQLSLQEKIEKSLENRVCTMLETALGPGKAIARVSCAVDFRKQEKTEEMYQPDNKAVRSEQIFSESGRESLGGTEGVPGVLSNTREGQAAMAEKEAAEATEGPGFEKNERTVNYEVSKVISHTVDSYPKVMRISTAVIVDGVHEYMEGENEKGEWKYSPRSDDEMSKLEKIVKRAVNFDSTRGDEIEVVNIPFKQMRPEWEELNEQKASGGWLSYVRKYSPSGKSMLLVALLFFLFIFVVRPLMRMITAGTAGNPDMLVRLPKTVSEMENEYGTEPQPNREEAVRLISSDEEHSLKLMRNWLGEEQV